MRQRSKNRMSTVLLVFVLLVLGLGYAYLTTNLNINGITDVDSNSWDVHWENLQVTNGSITGSQVITPATIDNTKTKITYNIRLSKPGEFYEFTVDAVNAGTIDAKIDSVISKLNGSPITTLPNYLNYTVSYASGEEIKAGQLLQPNRTRKCKIRVEFKKDINPEDLLDEYTELLFSFKINYVQGDPGAVELNTLNCEFNGEMVPGAKYTNGQYTYTYRGLRTAYVTGDETFIYEDITFDEDTVNEYGFDGWSVYLTDIESTAPVNTSLCHTINNKPIVIMDFMFSGSNAEEIDLSSFNNLDVLSMNDMFSFIETKYLDLRPLDTSSAVSMAGMFSDSETTNINLRNFDTSNAQDLGYMFYRSKVTNLDLSSFDTSNAKWMSFMFNFSEATTIDLSSFDTSNVEDMEGMFSYSNATSLDLSSFNTSNVKNMSWMFEGSKVTTLDLSSFNMSNVEEKDDMFKDCTATTGYARTQADANILNSTSGKPAGLTFVVH